MAVLAILAKMAELTGIILRCAILKKLKKNERESA